MLKRKLRNFIGYTQVFLLAFNPLLIQAAPAQHVISEGIEIDRAIGNDDKTGLKESANGTVVIDIAEASKGGVSHNSFNKYNVSADGVVVNNSFTPLISQLGGWTDGNRRLAGGSADIILMEVTGNSSSSLLGYSEILGDTAEFVLANSNGISCNGCGFINTPSVTLTTGAPELVNGVLQGFNVAKGSVIFDGLGMNASNVSQFTILTQAMALNASLYANNINIFTGLNYYDYNTKEIKSHTNQTSDGEFTFAFDASNLGAMYANNITLLGTQVGLGVRSEGLINAVNDLELTANGEIRVKDTLANQNLKLTTTSGDITTSGNLYANQVTINAQGTLTSEGTIGSLNDLTISGEHFNQLGNVYGGLTTSGELQDNAVLNINIGDTLKNQGTIINFDVLTLSAQNFNNDEFGIIQSNAINLFANTLTNAGDLNAAVINLEGANAVNLGNIQGNNLTLSFDDFSAEQGGIYQYGQQGSFVFTGDSIAFNGGLFITEGVSDITAELNILNNGDWLAQDKLQITTDSFTNTGTLEAQATTVLTANSLNNSGNILFTQQTNELQNSPLAVTQQIKNNGLLQFNSDNVTVNSQVLNNDNGQIVHLGADTLAFNITDSLTNTQGLIQTSGENLNINTTTLENTAGQISSIKSIEIKGQDLRNEQSLIDAGTELIIDLSGSLVNNASQISGQSFAINTSELSNNGGYLIADNQLSITGDRVNNQTQGLISAEQVKINATDLTNMSDSVIEGQTLSLSTDLLTNSGVLLASDTNTESLIISADSLINSGRIESHGTNLNLVDLTVNNNNGQLVHLGSGVLQLEYQQTLTNEQGLIYSAAQLALSGGNLHNQSGGITAQQQLNISLAKLNNQAGSITSFGGNTSNITVSGELNNQLGSIMLNNTTATIASQKINNESGQLINQEQNLILTAGTIENNETGLISAESDITFNAGSLTSSGTITGNSLNVLSSNINNSGDIFTQTATFDFFQLTNQGTIKSDGQLQLTGNTVNNSGNIITGSQDFSLSNLLLNNQSGNIIHNGQGVLTLDVLNDLNNQSGIITTKGSLILNAENLINNQGIIQVAQQADVSLTSLINESGQLLFLGENNATFTVTDSLHNDQGVIVSNASNINLSVTEVNNNQGEIVITGELTINAQQVENQQGVIKAGLLSVLVDDLNNNLGQLIALNNVDSSLVLNVNNQLNNDTGLIYSTGTNANILATTIDNTNGSIHFEQDGVIASQQLNNLGTGNINSQGELQLNVNELTNQGIINANELSITANTINNEGSLQSQTQNNDSLQLVTDTLTNSGIIFSQGENLSLTNMLLTNTDGSIVHAGAGVFTVDVLQALSNERGKLISNGALTINTDALNNQQGLLQSGGNLTVQLNNELTNDLGVISSGAMLDISAGAISNTQAEINAGQLIVNALNLDNEQGRIITTSSLGEAVNITLNDNFTNNNGQVIAAGQSAVIKSATLNNNDGTIELAGNGTLQINSLAIEHLGTANIATNGALAIVTDQLTASGDFSAEQISISADQVNHSGNLVAESSLELTANNINNQGQLTAGSILLVADQLNNSGAITSIETSSDSLQLTINELINNGDITSSGLNFTLDDLIINNNGGSIVHLGNGVLNIGTLTGLNNIAGIIATQGDLSLSTSAFNNEQGLVQALNQATITTPVLNNKDGEILLLGEQLLNLNITETLDNNQGRIAAGQLAITVKNLDNDSGVIEALSGVGQGLQLNVDELLNNQNGNIYSAGLNALINTDELANQAGNISHSGLGLLQIDANQINNSNAGVIASNGELALTANQLTNDGLLVSQGNMALTLSELINLSSANISANELSLAIATLTNSGVIEGNNGDIQSSVINNQGQLLLDGTLTVNANSLNNDNGLIQTAQDTNINVLALSNQSGQIINTGGNNIQITASNQLNNSQGLISTNALNNQLITDELINTQGNLQFLDDLNIETVQLNNQQGNILANNQQLTITNIDNSQAGQIVASNNLVITGEQLLSDGIIAADQLTLTIDNIDQQKNAQLSSVNTTITTNNLDNTGVIIAENLQLTSNNVTSNITNQGSISTSNLLQINSATINNSNGVLSSNNQLTLDAENVINQHGQIVSNSLIINSDNVNNNQGEIVAFAESGNSLTFNLFNELNNLEGLLYIAGGNVEINAAIINNSGNISYADTAEGNGVLALNSQVVNNTNTGTIESAVQLVINSTALNNAGILMAANTTLIGTNITNTGLIESETLTLVADDLIQQGSIATNQANITVTSLTNTGQILTTGQQQQSLYLTLATLNNSGVIANNGIDFSLSAIDLNNDNGIISHNGLGAFTLDMLNTLSSSALSNQAGLLSSAGHLTINADTVDNQQGEISAVALTSQSTLLNNQQGLLVAISTMNLNSDNLDNVNGQILALGDVPESLRITVTNQLDNQQGDIYSTGEQANISANHIDNRGGSFRHSGSDDLTLTSNTFNNSLAVNGLGANALEQSASTISSNSGLVLNGNQLTSGGSISADQLTLNNNGIDNQGDINALSLAINTNSLVNSGDIVSHDNIITSPTIINSGNIVAESNTGNSLQILSNSLTNSGSVISYGQDFSLSNIDIDNQNGELVHLGQGVFNIDTLNALNNQQGDIISQGQFIVNGGLLTNEQGLIQADNGINITVTEVNNQQGSILAFNDQALNINANSTIDNKAGLIGAQNIILQSGSIDNGEVATGYGNIAGQLLANNLQLSSDELTNSNGIIVADDLSINANNMVNDNGLLMVNQQLALNVVQTLNNNQGQIITSATQAIINANDLSNNGGLISQQSANDLQINVTNNISNTLGDITAAEQLIFNVTSLDNQGDIDANTLNINATQLNNQANLQANNLTITSDQINNSGVLLATGTSGQSLNLNAVDDIINQGQIQSHGQNLVFTQTVNNSQGTIVHAGTGELSFTQLQNQQGYIYALADFSINGSSLDNQNGVLQVAGSANFVLDNLNNQGGEISSQSAIQSNDQSNDLSINVNNSLNNQAGSIIADAGLLSINTQNLVNGSGTLAANNIELNADTISSNAGLIRAENLLTVTAQTLNNNNAAALSANNLNIDVKTVNNSSGIIESSNSMLLTLANINNQGGLVLSQGETFNLVMSGIFDNSQGGQLEVHSNNWHINQKNINNQSGFLRHMGTGELQVNSDQQLNNQSGLIASLGKLTLNLTGEDLQGSDNGQALNNSQGTIQASGNLVVNTPYAINNNQGQLLTEAHLALNSASLTNNAGQLLAAQGLVIDVDNNVQNQNGLIYNQTGNTTLTADTLDNGTGTLDKGIVQQGTGSLNLTLNQLTNSGEISGNGIASVTANTVTNNGLIQAQQLAINSTTLTNAGTLAGTLLTLTADNVNNQNGSLYASGLSGESLQINTTNVINNQAGLIQSRGSELNLLNGVNNTQGEILLLSTGTLSVTDLDNGQGQLLSLGNINSQGSLSNNNGTIEASKNISIISTALNSTLNNTAGSIHAEGQLTVQANNLTNAAGRITSAGNHYQINTSGAINNNNGGLLATSANNMNITGNSFTNQAGSVVHQGNGSLQLTGFDQLNNNGGTITSSGLISLALNSLTNNEYNGIQALISANTVNLTIDDISNNGGILQANALAITANNLTNTAGLILGEGTSNSALVLNVNNLTNTGGGIIESRGSQLNLSQVDSLNNNNGQIRHQGSGALTINQNGELNNNAGLVHTNGSLNLTTGNLLNNAGVISSQGTQQLTATGLSSIGGRIESAANLNTNINGAVNNSSGTIVAGGTLTLDPTGSLTNSNGAIFANGNAVVTASSINNDDGSIASNANLTLNGGSSLSNNSGIILANNQLSLTANTLDNSAGAIQAQTVQVSTNGELTNNNGSINGGTVNLNADALNNIGGTVLSTSSTNNSLTLATNTINNTYGTLASSAQDWSLSLNNISNNGGQLIHQGSGDFMLSSSGVMQNTGALVSNGNLQLTASSINNQGQVQAANTVTINSTLTNSGKVTASNININAGSSVINNTGSLSASSSLNLTAIAFINSNLLYSGNNTTINASSINNSGTLSANAASFSSFSTLSNSGRIEAAALNFSGNTLNNLNSGAIIASGSATNVLVFDVNQVTNQGSIYNSGANMSFGGALSNSGNLVHAGGGTLVLGGQGSVNINGGSVASAGTTSLKSSISGVGSLYAKKGLSIDTTNTFVNTNSTLYTEGNLQINSAVDNQGGKLIADGTLGINTSGTVNNTSGTLQGNNINIAAGTVINTNGTITSLGGGSGQINAGTINNSNGVIQSSNSSFSVNSTSGNVDNGSGTIAHFGTGTLTVTSNNNLLQDSGTIKTAGTLTAKAGGTLNNDGGTINADNFTITAGGSFSNNNGKVIGDSSGNSSLTASSINNNNGNISADGTNLTLSSGGQLLNNNGTIDLTGSGLLSLSGTSVTNGTGGSINSNGATTFNAGSSLTSNGIITSAGNLTVNSNNITNSSTLASRNAGVELNISHLLKNTGTITGKAAVDIDVSTLNNTSGNLQSDGNVNLDITSLSVGAINGNNIDIKVLSALTVKSNEKISASGNVGLAVNGNVTNQGTINATGDITLSGKQLTNSNSIKADGNGSLTFSNISNSGTLSSDNNLTVNSNVSSNSGTVAAGSALNITGNVNNTNLLFAKNNLNITGNVTNSSNILSLNDAALNGTITNNAGSIGAVRNLSLSGTITNNRSGSTSFTEGSTTTTKTLLSESGEFSPWAGIIASTKTTENRTTTTWTASASGNDGYITAGGNLSLSGNITNNYSTISAKGNISISGSGVTNNSAQNKQESEVVITEEDTFVRCDGYGQYYDSCIDSNYVVGVSNGGGSPTIIDSYNETTFDGGTYGSIIAGGSISGNVTGTFTANSGGSGPSGGGVSTNTSGSAGSASRGSNASGNSNAVGSLSSTNGSSQNTSGQNRTANAVNGNTVTVANTNQQSQQQTVNANTSQSNGASTTAIVLVATANMAAKAINSATNAAQTINNNQQSNNGSGQQQTANFSGNGAVVNASAINGGGPLISSDLNDNGYTPNQVVVAATTTVQSVDDAQAQNQGTSSTALVQGAAVNVASQENTRTVTYYQGNNTQAAQAVGQSQSYNAVAVSTQGASTYSAAVLPSNNNTLVIHGDLASAPVAANDASFNQASSNSIIDNLDNSAVLIGAINPLNIANNAPEINTNNAVTSVDASQLQGSDTGFTLSEVDVVNSVNLFDGVEQRGNASVNPGVNVGEIGIVNTTPDHNYETETREEYLSEKALISSSRYLAELGHNPDVIIKDMVDQQEAQQQNQVQQQQILSGGKITYRPLPDTTTLDKAALSQTANTDKKNAGFEIVDNIFLSEAQLQVLTQDLGFDSDEINAGQQVLYTAVNQKDLLKDGATISAGTYINITADEGLVLETGIRASDGVTLRSEGGLTTGNNAFIDSAAFIGLELGGDFTNNLALSSDQLWLDIGGDFVNNAWLEGDVIDLVAGGDFTNNSTISAISDVVNGSDSELWLSSGGDFTNNQDILSSGLLNINSGGDLVNQQALISGKNVSLLAANDIINRTEFTQTTKSYEGKHGTNKFVRTEVGAASTIILTNSLSLNAGNNLDLQGSKLNTAGDMQLRAGNDILLGAIERKSGKETQIKRGYNINYDTTYDVVDLQAGNNLQLIAGNNLDSQGAQFSAGGDVGLAAGNALNLLAVTETHLTSTKKTKKKTFSKKVTYEDTQHDIVQGSTVTAGGDVLINALKDENGNLSVQQTGDVNIVGSTLDAQGNALIAGNNINVLAQSYTDYEMKSVVKKSWGGLKNKAAKDAEKTQKLSSSTLNSSGDLTLFAGDDITIAGSDLTSNGNLNITAFDELLVTSAEESSLVEHKRKKGGFFTGGNFYSSKEKSDGEAVTSAYASNLNSAQNINIDAGSAEVVASNVNAEANLNVHTDLGDIDILSATETTSTNSYEKEMQISFGGALESFADPGSMVSSDDGQLKISLANATYDKVEVNTDRTKQAGSILSANNNITLDSVADINIEGADLFAGNDENLGLASNPSSQTDGNINLFAGGDVSIIEAEESYKEVTKEVHGSAEVSVVVQHQAVEVVKAALAVKEAKDAAKQAKKDYSTYKDDRKSLENTLAQLESEYESGEPGVTYIDVIELRDLLDEVKDDEEWYVAGVALAAANVVSKTTGLIQQTAAAAQSTATYGFNAGVQLDIDATKTNSEFEESTSRASNLTANNINIATGLNSGFEQNSLEQESSPEQINTSTTFIQGSDLNASNSLNIATGELNIQASRDTSSNKSETNHGHITIAQTVYGAASGPTVSASFDRNENKDNTTTFNNSTLKATDINISTTGDTVIEGGNVAASNDLNLYVGGDLTLESKQNRTSGSNKGFGISGGFGFGGDTTKNTGKTAATSRNVIGDTSQGVSSVNGGLNVSNGRYQTRDTILSSITAGNNANINVDGNSNIVGALIATQDEAGNDTAKLNFNTGSLTFTDLKNTSYNSSQSMGISTSVGVSGNTDSTSSTGATDLTAKANQSNSDLNVNSSNLSYSNTSSVESGKTLATLGQGDITVGGENLDDMSGEGETAEFNINRDVTAIDKELYSVDRQQGNIDLTVDHRLLSEEGREVIAGEMDDMGGNVQIIAQNVPAATGGNTVENFIGEALNTLGDYTLGLTPSDKTSGGLIAQIPILLGADDNKHAVIQVRDPNSEYVTNNPDGFILGNELPFFNELEQPDKDLLENVVVSKYSVKIDAINVTIQNTINGQSNLLPLAIANGMGQSDSEVLTVGYNPTHGGISDTLESGVDTLMNILGIDHQTGIAQQTGVFVSDVVHANDVNNQNSNFSPHSQANALIVSGVNSLADNTFTDLNNSNLEHNVFMFGSPVNANLMEETLNNTGVLTLSGAKSNPRDFVAEVIGGNKGEYIPDENPSNRPIQLPAQERLGLLGNALKLFDDKYPVYEKGEIQNSTSPHSDYECIINCGEKGDIDNREENKQN